MNIANSSRHTRLTSVARAGRDEIAAHWNDSSLICSLRHNLLSDKEMMRPSSMPYRSRSQSDNDYPWRNRFRRLAQPASTLAALTAVVSCSGPVEPLSFNLVHVPPTSAESQCVSDPGRLSEQLPSGYTLRLSVLRRPPDLALVSGTDVRKWDLVCDLALPPKAPPAAVEFQIPTNMSERPALRMEVFDAEKRLALSGQLTEADLDATSQTIYLHPSEAHSCWLWGTWTSAFHSATLLPNGKVVLVGGVRGALSGRLEISDGKLYPLSVVAVLDPSDLTLQLACQPEDGAMPARAFHEAVLLPSDPAGPYRILLLGGMTSGGDAPVAAERERDQPFRISPTDSAVAAEAGILTLTLGEDSSCNGGAPEASYLAASELTDVAGFFPTVSPIDDGQAVAFVGGARHYETAGSGQGFDLDSATAEPASVEQRAFIITIEREPKIERTIALRRVRAGHGAARAGRNRVLVLGGVMDGTSSELTAEYGAGLTSSEPEVTPIGLGPISGQTAWQTLNEIGLTDASRAAGSLAPGLLLYGGYELEPGNTAFFRYAFDPGPVAAQLLTIGETFTAESYQAPAEAPPLEITGFHQATAMADGSILVSGGNANKRDCPVGEQTLQLESCALDQLALLELHEGELRQRPGLPADLALQFPRYGHRATRLLDNTVLITGGLQVDPEAANRLRIVSRQEIVNVSTGGPDESFFTNSHDQRQPAQSLMPCGLRK